MKAPLPARRGRVYVNERTIDRIEARLDRIECYLEKITRTMGEISQIWVDELRLEEQ